MRTVTAGQHWRPRRLVIALLAGAIGLSLALPNAGPAAGRHPAAARSTARARASAPHVLLVGTYQGIPGQYTSIQAAVDAARPGDWILVAPGDYHERADHRANRGPQAAKSPAGLIISTPAIHLRGMDRNGVVVDGTLPGSPQCSSAPASQDFGVAGPDGKPLGRNGIVVWKVDGVSIDNLTACNFLNGTGAAGNEIWWNGGDGTGHIALHNFRGSYLTASSTFFKDPSTAASYGIFSSNANGGSWDYTYASNMSDSNYYIGACAQLCNQVVDHAHSQYSTQGYSGTNAGGSVLIENSEFDHNKTGVTAGALNNDDWPSPQDGACPNGATSPVTHTYSCWVFTHNYVHDNNNPNVPGVGIAAAAPTGTGLLLYGGRNNTISHNVFADNGAWGIAFTTYPDTETPPDDAVAAGAACRGGVNSGPPANVCAYDDWGNAVLDNTFRHNGFFGNDSNSDFGEITTTAAPTNCFHGNVEQGGGAVTSSPSGLQQSKPACDRHTAPPDNNPRMTNQLVCDSQAFASSLPGGGSTPCLPPGYPQPGRVVLPPIPSNLATMPNPCAGVPANAWCAGGLGLPGGRRTRCLSGRRFTIHIRRRDLLSVRVYVNGRRVRVLRGRGLRAVVDLRGLPAGAVRVRIVAIRRGGRRLTAVRTYHTCTSRRRLRHRRSGARPKTGGSHRRR